MFRKHIPTLENRSGWLNFAPSNARGLFAPLPDLLSVSAISVNESKDPNPRIKGTLDTSSAAVSQICGMKDIALRNKTITSTRFITRWLDL